MDIIYILAICLFITLSLVDELLCRVDCCDFCEFNYP